MAARWSRSGAPARNHPGPACRVELVTPQVEGMRPVELPITTTIVVLVELLRVAIPRPACRVELVTPQVEGMRLVALAITTAVHDCPRAWLLICFCACQRRRCASSTKLQPTPSATELTPS